MVKTADKVVKNVKNKARHSEGVGSKQLLDDFQCCLAHCSLRELAQQEDSSLEEAQLIDVVWRQDLMEARVVSSTCWTREADMHLLV